MIRMLLGGAVAGLSFVLTSEYLRVQRGAAKSCPQCSAPVGRDGLYRGEREPRSYLLSFSDHPSEWTDKQSRLRKMKCCGCKKPLDITSVIIFDRAWHKRCLVCANCKKKLTGNRYYMINNKPYDVACYKQAKERQKNTFTHTIIDNRFPDPSVSIPTVSPPLEKNGADENASTERSTSSPHRNNLKYIPAEALPFRTKTVTTTKLDGTRATSSTHDKSADKKKEDKGK